MPDPGESRLKRLWRRVTSPMDADVVFDKTTPKAESWKTMLEMAVGAFAVVGVLARAVTDLAHLKAPDEVVIFHIVAGGLAIVAAIELAYTLFTPGPDEVVDPLMLGLSSALLFQVGKIEHLDWSTGVGVALFVAALGGLFAIRKKYVEPHERDRKKSRTSNDLSSPDQEQAPAQVPTPRDAGK